MRKFVLVLATVLVASVTTTFVRGAVVYNNTSAPTGMVNVLLPSGEVNSPEHGNQITLGGGERIVTNITIRMRIRGGGAATFKTRVRFYRNDGPGGSPQTMIFDSGPQTGVIDSGADLSYPFAVPNVRVPATFTYSVQITERQIYLSAPIGPAEYHPGTVGSAPFGFWRNTGANAPDWQFVNPNEPPFSARVDANPIPGDVNVNGEVNVDDLLAVINSWGPCPRPCPPHSGCPADVAPAGGNCSVNVDDLLLVINNWS